MPNPDIFVLPEVPDDFKKLAADKPEWMKFMPKVEEEMAKTLGLTPYNPAAPDPSQFGCYGCHPSIFPQQTLVGFTHQEMSEGKFCGRCHDGRTAFAIPGTACSRCHVDAR